MAKRTIDARQALIDIRKGMSDQELMEKFSLSAQGLQSLYRKLIGAGVLTRQELDDRDPLFERTVSLDVFRCPSCNMPQLEPFDVCPQCGVIVSKFRDQKTSLKKSASKLTSREMVQVTLSIPRDFHRKLSLMQGGLAVNVIEALDTYLKTSRR